MEKMCTEVESVKQENAQLQNHITDIEQHHRNKNVEIHVPVVENESTDQIVKSVAEAMGVTLKEGELL